MNHILHFKKHRYLYLYLLLLAFLLLKMTRGLVGYADTQSGGIWNAIQLLFMFIGIAFFFSKYNNRLPAINILLFYSIWVMFVSLLNLANRPITSLSSWFYYFTTPCAPLIMMVFYCVIQKEEVDNYSFLIKLTYYILVLLFYYSMTNFRSFDEEGDIAYSDIYYPMALLPLVLQLTKPSRSFIPLLAMMMGVFVSSKRGGLIMLALVAVVYYFVGNKRKKSNYVFMILLFAGLIVGSSLLMDYIDSSYNLHTVDRLMNSAEDGGSGRISRWDKTLSEIGMSNIGGLLFGHGFNAIYQLVGGRAHNDFIEIFYNFGFVSFVIYSLFFINLISINIKQYRKRYNNAKFLTCSILVALVMALFSFYIVEPGYVLCSMFTTGLLLGEWEKYNNNYYLNNTNDGI